MPACTNDIAVAVIALMVALTSLVQILIVHYRMASVVKLLVNSPGIGGGYSPR